ncbi:hypothetical protein Q9S36_16100 [Microbacterium sp. ARD31]|uniref:hypothetical protein n=1 Tax=Microbacterium sp. ARD31 TaxID=2962576 RepID=UPI002880F58D|nr:hypothetical protein [Microbacterium sp. ARD31]MDT0181700.1 hypothetical protein [Microbacterium sp. ARD31]
MPSLLACRPARRWTAVGTVTAAVCAVALAPLPATAAIVPSGGPGSGPDGGAGDDAGRDDDALAVTGAAAPWGVALAAAALIAIGGLLLVTRRRGVSTVR